MRRREFIRLAGVAAARTTNTLLARADEVIE
jgi:hypothetical protein